MTLTGCAGLVALLALTGCAHSVTNAAAPATATEHVAPAGAGTILSLRVVAARSDSDPWRVALLADAGGATASLGDGSAGQITEFIVRIDGGSTISVVQTNELGFRVGDRVIVLHDGHTRLARPG
jgi:outer membrane lipoprotein SlyB